MKPVTPIIKKTRVKTERYEVCPHCRQKIHEKSIYMDEDNYVYHRPCMENGPIDQITRQRIDSAWESAFGKPLSRAAQTANVSTHAGFFEKNVTGKNYKIEWRAKLATDGTRTPDDVIVDKPDSMPEYLWYQVKDSMQAEAEKAAMIAKQPGKPVQTASVKRASNWLERSMKTAETTTTQTLQMEGQPIDQSLLTDGLGAFLKSFINYHTNKEGTLLTKWMIALCKDPKYTNIAEKLEQLHNLMEEIYNGVLEIAKLDSKVAKTLYTVKKAETIYKKRSIKTAEVYDDDDWEFTAQLNEESAIAMAKAEEKAKKQQKFVIESRDNSQSEWMPSSVRTGFSNLEEAVSMILKIVKRHSGEPHNEYRVLDYTGDVVWLSPTAEDEDGRLDFEEPVPTVGRDLAIPDRTNIQDGRQNWTRERWEEAAGYGERESYLVAAIRQHLITEEQRRELFNRNVTIEDMLNGRVEGEDAEEFTGRLYADWNAKLGWHEFGY